MVKQSKDGQNNLLTASKYAQRPGSVEVFKTNVQFEKDAQSILVKLEKECPGSDINFDLEDCDKVLRIAFHGHTLDERQIKDIVRSFGFSIELLQDL